MSRPVCGICMCLEDETGCGCGQNNDQISTTLHDNNSNVNVQVDKNPTFKGGSNIPVAWIEPDGFVKFDIQWARANQDAKEPISLYTSPQYREDGDAFDKGVREGRNQMMQELSIYFKQLARWDKE